jgi:hypothetical protein
MRFGASRSAESMMEPTRSRIETLHPNPALDRAGPIFYKPKALHGAGGFLEACPPKRIRKGLAQVAQLVEQRTENPRVGGSIPPLGTTTFKFDSIA